jgi:hypothetical protein
VGSTLHDIDEPADLVHLRISQVSLCENRR